MAQNSDYTILVADDDKEIAGAVEYYLRNEGFCVIKAYDGFEALEAARHNDVSLIIMDVMMPKCNGLIATMKIRESSNVPILMLSAKTEGTDRVLGLEAGGRRRRLCHQTFQSS